MGVISNFYYKLDVSVIPPLLLFFLHAELQFVFMEQIIALVFFSVLVMLAA